jgi:sugar phosphate isomerase/epimerase
MKLGFFTAALPDSTLEQAAQWGAENDFQAIEIACWPPQKATRRYAGVTHFDVSNLDKKKAKEIRKMLDGYGLTVSSLGYYPNPLHPEAEHRETVIAHLKKVIEGAALLEVPIVGTFIGKDKNKTVPQNLEDYANVWPPIVKFAKDHGIKIAIENCPMIFSYDEWPGGNNLAASPAIWRRMWEIIPDDNFGLNLDPSHLIWQMIDYERVIREFADKLFHVHAKDVDWGKFFAALGDVGYDYVVSIEHEDRDYEGDEDLVKKGFYLSRDFLKTYIR